VIIMRVYLDMCCLKRPFDDQSQARVATETSAILGILSLIDTGKLVGLRSPAHEFENALNPDPRRASAVQSWLDIRPVLPANQSSIDGNFQRLRGKGLSQFPRDARPQHEDDAGECLAVGDGLAARVPEPRLGGREHRLDQRPQVVVQDRLGHIRASMHRFASILPATLFIGIPSRRSVLSERRSYARRHRESRSRRCGLW